MRTDSTAIAGVAMGEAREVIARALRRAATRAARAGSTRRRRRAPRRRTRRSGRRRSRATRSRCAGALKPEEFRLYRLIWQRALASQMAAKELETTTVELRPADTGCGPARRGRCSTASPRSTPRATTTPPRRRSGTLPALAEGDVTTRARRHPDPALHRAAAALHRGDADQGARGARHRPAVDLRGDDLDDRRPRLRPGRGAAPAPRGRRRGRHRPARRALRRVRRRRLHGADGGGARRGRRAASASGCRCCASSTGRCGSASTRSARSSSAATSRPRRPTRSARRATRWSSGSAATAGSWPARCTPSTRRRGRCPGEEARRRSRAWARPARSAARATLVDQARPVRAFVGCSRYPDCDYIQQGRPAAARAAAVRGHVPQERATGHLVGASRAADRQRLLGLLALPEVRLHDEPRADRRAPRCRRRPGGAVRAARGRPASA